MSDPRLSREAAWEAFERELDADSYLARRRAWRALAVRLSAEQNHRCCHCGKRTNEARRAEDMPTIEHIVPRSRGGCDDPRNLAIACWTCNTLRGWRIFWRPGRRGAAGPFDRGA